MIYVRMIGGLLELDENGDEPTNAEVTPRDQHLTWIAPIDVTRDYGRYGDCTTRGTLLQEYIS